MKNPTLEFMTNSIDANIKRYKAGDKATAFRNIGKMRIRSLSKEEKNTLVIAGEMMQGIGVRIYSQMGYEMDVMEHNADQIIKHHFLYKEEK